MNWKRVLIGVIVMVLLLVGGYFVYQQFFAPPPAEETIQTEVGQTGTESTTTAVNTTSVSSSLGVVSAEGQIVPLRQAMLSFVTGGEVEELLVAAGTAVHERVWPLPLWDDYKDAIKSDVADIKNSGGRMGGVATSAIFLKQFTDYNWAHLDIAGMALSDKGSAYTPRGGTGYGVRLLVEFLRHWK